EDIMRVWMRYVVLALVAFISTIVTVGCGGKSLPTAPSSPSQPAPTTVLAPSGVTVTFCHGTLVSFTSGCGNLPVVPAGPNGSFDVSGISDAMHLDVKV